MVMLVATVIADGIWLPRNWCRRVANKQCSACDSDEEVYLSTSWLETIW